MPLEPDDRRPLKCGLVWGRSAGGQAENMSHYQWFMARGANVIPDDGSPELFLLICCVRVW